MRCAAGLLLLAALPALAAEVTVMRPKGLIAQDWPNYILIDGKVMSDLMPGERVTLQVPAETRALVVHCPRGLGGYEESRIDYDFRANATARFVISAAPTCVRIEALDARDAGSAMRQTTPRLASRPVEYGTAAVVIRPSLTPAPTDAAAPLAAITAATSAWIEAFNSRDPARMTALYDAEAVLSDSGEPQPRVGAAAIADYYKNAMKRTTQRVALGERHVRLLGDTAIDRGALTYSDNSSPGRYSLTYQQRGGKWLIVDHHTSTPR
jgi:hypothetical protein